MQECVSSGCVYLHRCRLGWGGGSQGAVTTQREQKEGSREGGRDGGERREERGGESVSETWAFHQSTATAEGGSSGAITVQLKFILT